MSEQTYLVLLALADEPRHGYAVVQEVRALSDDRVKLGAGTLYGILDRLVAAGQTEVSNEVVVEGRLRRYYRLTPGGRAVVEAHTAELAALARRARLVLGRPVLGGV
ncbi:MAG: PadR family transcriptional regulator [Cellulomonas sp.]|nr:PadR family transcriptional regulator [Cellulomonas sp.]